MQQPTEPLLDIGLFILSILIDRILLSELEENICGGLISFFQWYLSTAIPCGTVNQVITWSVSHVDVCRTLIFVIITKTCPCNVYPLEPHLYLGKLGYAGVYLLFLILIQNIDCGTR